MSASPRPLETWGTAVPVARPAPAPEAARRLRRLRSLAWFLDRSIPLGGGRRIGLDPIIGLMPGAGDGIGALLSLYVLYEGARLGVRAGVLMRMGGNVLIETVVGAVPLLGDFFDFIWQANTRNLALVEKHYHPELRARSLKTIWAVFLGFAAVVIGLLAASIFAAVKLLQAIF